jgi:hypothetical protein
MTASPFANFAIIAAVVYPGLLPADAQLSIQGSHGLPPGSVYVSQGKVRLETATGPKGGYAIYDRASQTLYAVDANRRKYYVVDTSTAARLEGLAGYRQQILGVLRDQLSAGQREALQEQLSRFGLSGLGPTQTPPEPQLLASAESRTVHGIVCGLYRIVRGGEVMGELCVADPGDLPISGSDYDTLKSLAAFASRLADQATPVLGNFRGDVWAQVADRLPGVPIAVTDLRSAATARLAGVSNAALTADLFQVPVDFRRAELPLPTVAGG